MRKFARLIQLSRQRAREGQLSFSRQLLEMVALKAMRDLGPMYYHMAGYWRPEIPWEVKVGQVSAREYKEILVTLNPAEYRKLSQHKVPEKALLTLHGIPTPRYLGLLSFSRGVDVDGLSLRRAVDLDGLVTRRALRRLVLKQVEGHGGYGVRVLEAVEQAPLTYVVLGRQAAPQQATQLFESEFQLEAGNEWLVEEYFEQHPVTAAFNATSVNSVRIWVRSEADRRPLLAYLRIGRKGMCVDNGTSGGILAPIDLETGVLGPAQEPTPERTMHSVHPDSGAQIVGVQLPFWPEVYETAVRALRVFPHMRFAGCDVAIGPAGPVILELNLCPDREGAIYCDVASLELLQ
jgi:hypothetical protein